MATKVCDRCPCDQLQMALDALVRTTEDAQSFALVVNARRRADVHFTVPLVYCPFCGTRIEEEWVRTFVKHFQPKRGAA